MVVHVMDNACGFQGALMESKSCSCNECALVDSWGFCDEWTLVDSKGVALGFAPLECSLSRRGHTTLLHKVVN